MNAGEAILALLAAGEAVAARVVIVVAHPDDETIGLGAQLGRFRDALLVHVTGGAPRDGEDARRYGFAGIADYAGARERELAAALRAGEALRLRRLALGIPDKEAWRDLAGLARRLADVLRVEEPACVFTHAYEGGHPDHDAAAFAVRAACRLAATPPAIVEMPFYHRRDGRFVTGEFLPAPSPRNPGIRVYSLEIAGEARRRKQRMIDCFATQLWLLEQFDLATERFRVAPEYDFRRPPHPGALHYETLGWGIAGADWQREAASALARLGLGPSCHREEHGDDAIPSERMGLLRFARDSG
jgi:LmbE family N-acetylglucosaminyl deacetylase